MGFSRQEYWSGLPFPSPGDLPDPGIKLGSPSLQADSLPSEPPGKPEKRGSSLCSFGRYLYFCSRIQSPPVLKFLDLMEELARDKGLLFFNFFFYLARFLKFIIIIFKNLFIFGYAGSSLLPMGFL